MKTADYIAHSEALASALIKFQVSEGTEKDHARAAYMAMPQLIAPEHDADIVAEAHAGDKTARALLRWADK